MIGVAQATAADPAKRPAEAAQDDLFDSDEFRMYAYKILPCPKRGVHEWSTCPYSHPNEKARRRDPRIYNYLAIPCEATKQGGTCPRGDDCPNCHSLFEYWLHPSRYRTQLCRDMENGHCKRSVCFFAHSIEELRVPDHSHLNIPPEMQAAASGSGRSSSQPSTDVSAAGSSDSSGCSTPRAGSNSRGSDAKPPQSSATKAQNIAGAQGSNSHSHSAQRPASRGSRGSTNSSSPTQWTGFGTPAASTLLGDAYNSSPGGYYHAAGMAAAAALEQQRSVLQLQHCQMQAQGLFEQQMHHNLLAAQAEAAAQAQQQQAQQQLMLLHAQRSQQAAAYLARNSTGGIRGGSPPLSPVPSFDRPASFGGDTRNFFVPPSSANAGTLAMASAQAQAQANWQSAALLRSLSTPAHTGSGSLGSELLRQGSGFSGLGVPPSPASNFGSSSNAAGVQLHNSGGSLIDGQADLTLGALLSAASSQGLTRSDSQTWGAAGSGISMSLGMPTSSVGLPLGCGLQGSGMGDLFSGGGGAGAGMDGATASLLMLQQQQQMQQQKAAAAMGNLLPGFGNGSGDVGSEQVLRLMMQQLALQQQSAVM